MICLPWGLPISSEVDQNRFEFLQSAEYSAEDCWKEMFSFLVETMENAVKSWHEKSTVEPRVYFLLHPEKTDSEKYAPVVNIDKVFILLLNGFVILLLLHLLFYLIN